MRQLQVIRKKGGLCYTPQRGCNRVFSLNAPFHVLPVYFKEGRLNKVINLAAVAVDQVVDHSEVYHFLV